MCLSSPDPSLSTNTPWSFPPRRRARKSAVKSSRNVATESLSRGLTLIELVVALVLASLMLVALLRVVSVISIESNQLKTEQTDYVAASMLADRIRSDMINARGMVVDSGSISMSGFSTDEQLPSAVRYATQIRGRDVALYRITPNQSELCWFGFGRFEYQPFDEIDSETPLPDAAGGLPQIPARFLIRAYSSEGRVLFSEVIDHHAQS